MDSRTVRYGRMGTIVILNFPDENGAKDFIMRLETQNILRKMELDKTPIHTVSNELKPRIVA